jgi:hypothetical protein
MGRMSELDAEIRHNEAIAESLNYVHRNKQLRDAAQLALHTLKTQGCKPGQPKVYAAKVNEAINALEEVLK